MDDAGRDRAARLNELLKLELCGIVAQQSIKIMFPVLGTQLLIAATVLGRAPAGLVAAWLGAVALVHAARIVLLRRPAPLDAAQADRRIDTAIVLSLVSGIVNGSSAIFLAYLTPYLQAIQSVLLLGLCAGCVAVNVGHFRIVVAFLAPIIGALAYVWTLQVGGVAPRWESAAAGALVLVFGLILISLSRDTYRTFVRSIDIRFENAQLTQELSAALQRAEAASRSKTRFLASASHDLRQPLHTLSFNAAALAFRPLDSRAREIVRDMGEALEDLSYELDSLLDISKLDAGVVPVTHETFELGGCLARICQSFRAIAQARGLGFDTRWPANLYVRTDRKLLEGIFRNLIDNAFKYTASGSVSVTVQQHEGCCTVAVCDTGIGIAPSEKERVFEEFYQIGNPERDRRKGLGLGLPIVKRHADLLGLEVVLDSEPGIGSRFRVELQAVPPPPCAEPSPASALPAFHDLQLLVVDDEARSREAMQGYLEALGCQVCVAATLNEATALAQLQEPDLVIADFRLRGTETGLQVIEALRKTRPLLPALLITGDTAPEKLAEMNAARIPLLHKPVLPAVLIDNIASLLDSP